MILAGFAAPLFLCLAGVAVVLAANAAPRGREAGRRRPRILRRGPDVFLLALVFRIQAFLLTPGELPSSLLRVDILNVMGPAIVRAAGLIWGLPCCRAVGSWPPIPPSPARASPCSRRLSEPRGLGQSTADLVPVAPQAGRRAHDVSMLLPWAGFVFAGAAAGALLATARGERSERRANVAMAVIGAALIALGFYTAGRPSIYRRRVVLDQLADLVRDPRRDPDAGAGVRCTGSSSSLDATKGRRHRASRIAFARSRCRGKRRSSGWDGIRSSSTGSTSSCVYGYSSWLWRHRLPLWGTAIAYVLFCVLMYRAIGWRDRFVGFWRARPRGAPVSAPSG